MTLRSTPKRRPQWVAKIKAYMSTLPPAPVVVIKEPKMTALIGMWFEGARQAGFDVAAVIAVRPPEEVVESLAKRARRQIYVQASPELVQCLVAEVHPLGRKGHPWCAARIRRVQQPTRGLAPGSQADFDRAGGGPRRDGTRVPSTTFSRRNSDTIVYCGPVDRALRHGLDWHRSTKR